MLFGLVWFLQLYFKIRYFPGWVGEIKNTAKLSLGWAWQLDPRKFRPIFWLWSNIEHKSNYWINSQILFWSLMILAKFQFLCRHKIIKKSYTDRYDIYYFWIITQVVGLFQKVYAGLNCHPLWALFHINILFQNGGLTMANIYLRLIWPNSWILNCWYLHPFFRKHRKTPSIALFSPTSVSHHPFLFFSTVFSFFLSHIL